MFPGGAVGFLAAPPAAGFDKWPLRETEPIRFRRVCLGLSRRAPWFELAGVYLNKVWAQRKRVLFAVCFMTRAWLGAGGLDRARSTDRRASLAA